MSFDISTYGNVLQTNYAGYTLGSAATGIAAIEGGNKRDRWVELTIESTLPAIAGGAALAVGKLLYTLPPGAIFIKSVFLNVALTQVDGNINADTPDVGLGGVIGSGAVATLDGTATFEDILTGQTFNNCNGTAEVLNGAGASKSIAVGDSHQVFLNVADTWAASGETALPVTGKVVLHYTVDV